MAVAIVIILAGVFALVLLGVIFIISMFVDDDIDINDVLESIEKIIEFSDKMKARKAKVKCKNKNKSTNKSIKKNKKNNDININQYSSFNLDYEDDE